jgi:hypothetical protein
MLTICKICFNIKKENIFFMQYIYVLYDSQNQQRLFPHATGFWKKPENLL